MTEILAALGVSRRFRTTLAVDRVDFALGAGARHAVIGPNGAGKSTLLNLLTGTLRPNTGQVQLDGRDITGRSPAGRARLGLARTFQTPAVFDSLSTLDNMLAAAWRGNRARSREARVGLDAIGLGGHTRHLAGALSHGQRRLLEIAMALAGSPRVLLLDEPAAGLGDTDLERLVTCLRGLPDRIAVLLVEHNQDVVTAIAHRVTVLHQGRILASGTPEEIKNHPEVADIYLGKEAMTPNAAT
ncbi:MAG TPA: ATP-binding cassette domain-containing protein [Candidatus Limnocylindrales bacterium]|nr:ATP-binding cassette domain-containing protein [Candidatus Limnocylindrales bacterium]